MNPTSNRRRNVSEPSDTNIIAEQLIGLRHELEALGDTLANIRQDIQWAVQNLMADIRTERGASDSYTCRNLASTEVASIESTRLGKAHLIIIDLLSSKQLSEATADSHTNSAVGNAIEFLQGGEIANEIAQPKTGDRNDSADRQSDTANDPEHSDGYLF